MKYFYADKDNKPVGPLPREALESLRISGVITDSTMVIEEGASEWKKFSDAFVSRSAPPPPPPPPPPPLTFEVAPPATFQASSREQKSDTSLFRTRKNQGFPNSVLEELLQKPFMQNASEASESQVVMGVMHLQNNEPEKAVLLFESALQTTYRVPAAWLGKAYAEAMLTSVEKNTLELIQYSFEKASQFIDDHRLLAKHYATVLFVALGRSAIQIQEHFESSANLASRAAHATASALRSAALGVASACMGYTSKSTFGKIVGYGGATAAGVHATNRFMDSVECSRLSNSAYALAIAQSYISLAYVYEVRNVFPLLPPEVQVEMKTVTDKVKEKWLLLYQSQLQQLAVFVEKIEKWLQTPEGVDKIVALQGNYQEVIDVAFMAEKFGLETHESFSKLSDFTDGLEKAIESADARSDLQTIKNGRKAGFATAAVLFLVGFVPFFTSDDASGIREGFEMVCETAAFVVAAITANLASKAQKEMIQKCAAFKSYLSNAHVTVNDFSINCDLQVGP
jgi:hypothetical protein